jgi:hypothetical protein
MGKSQLKLVAPNEEAVSINAQVMFDGDDEDDDEDDD